MEISLDRRDVLRGAAVAAGIAAIAPMEALAARTASAQTDVKKQFSPDYGPLAPVKDQTTGLELLLLPRGFEYLTFGWTGDRMADGIATPGVHDGMAAYRRGDRVHLVRNHEVGSLSGKFADPAYDPQAGGGTTNLIFNPDKGELVEARASLSGTIRNCAGGPTPWDTWLTCEETTLINAGNGMRHGYVFEVPSAGTGNPNPIKEMGRFSHEAVAIDPATGWVYETEDAGSAGFYRFRPNTPGNLHGGGVLEMLVINGPRYDTRKDGTGTTYASTSWVTIDEPDPATGVPFTEGFAKGGAVFARLEGAWYAGGKVYIVSTSGGPAGQGQIFEYEPATGALKVLFASPSPAVLNNPDNICVSPRGGMVLCEDGSGIEYMHGLTTDGDIFPFAANNVVIPDGGVPGRANIAPGDYRGSEWCGATFEPKNGNWLFANIQSPGITFAITGPWKQGSL
ncbi:alkaline phosphatase PhoX [Allorhizocola rhizosphaerae]|uniref:alkaline phosphatase PhoX n=1 Tax=Allorhizocola rhizosphaerae TaxID=1872709 RepID=UPI000E3E482B|nr:alkaline phosphatase PhoX [Allorhizocola rhizosphaerae]